MSLSIEDVHRIALLARLELSSDDALATRQQLNDIFVLIEGMKVVDTEGVEPMSHAQELVLRLRADEVTEPDLRERYQSVAPQVEQGLYLVPRVIE
jgi:aspartyl-tRNA(Asn)/glutamyl-tRNA(Gln) amidotransferase subunit C